MSLVEPCCRRYEGRVAVVTGGTTGIGRAVVDRLHGEGACVVICARRAEPGRRVVEALGGDRAVFVATDVTDRAALARLYAEAVERFERIDVLVNNAGNVVVAPTMRMKPEHWRRTIALNLDAVFDSCQLAIPHLRASVATTGIAAAIVNVASLDSVAADRGFAAYNAAKAGVVNLSRSLALEFGPESIRVNAVSPGAVETALTETTVADPAARAAFQAAIPLRRFGLPHEIAAAVAFVASPEASFVNGANLLVDGGVTAGTGHPDLVALFGMA